jgi:hypothetical protein
MEEIAGWIAPLATTIAACMTAANLGARVTGWGFVVFTIGSLAWSGYGLATGQLNLLWQNLFLTAVNAAGIWCWLGRQARIDDGADKAAKRSEVEAGPSLFPSSMLQSASVETLEGDKIGQAVDAMIDRADGRTAYLVVETGSLAGSGGAFRILPWSDARVQTDRIVAAIRTSEIKTLVEVGPNDWPVSHPDVQRH